MSEPTEQIDQTAATESRTGAGSFCVPRAAINALLAAKATAYEICSYLTLAAYTDETGCYSAASVSAINKATGANKTRTGPVATALNRLKTINDSKGDPILLDREGWFGPPDELPDGPTDRGRVRHILPDFGEPLNDRIWFGKNLVTGVGGFPRPLRAVKNGGDVAARMLLALYAFNDMETWGGVSPLRGPWRHYEPVSPNYQLEAGGVLIRSKGQGEVLPVLPEVWSPTDPKAYWKEHTKAGEPLFRALEVLESNGLIYESVLVLNRDPIPATFASTKASYGRIPPDAEPLYELDARSLHGYKPEGEAGLAGITANLAGHVQHSVALEGGKFDGTYAAIVKRGQGAMIVGVFRLRFRVSNPKNAGVRPTWGRIYDNNREALDLVNAIRAAYGLESAISPFPNRPRTLQSSQ